MTHKAVDTNSVAYRAKRARMLIHHRSYASVEAATGRRFTVHGDSILSATGAVLSDEELAALLPLLDPAPTEPAGARPVGA